MMEYTFFHYRVAEENDDALGHALTSHMADSGIDWVQVPSDEAEAVRQILSEHGAVITKEYTRAY